MRLAETACEPCECLAGSLLEVPALEGRDNRELTYPVQYALHNFQSHCRALTQTVESATLRMAWNRLQQPRKVDEKIGERPRKTGD